MRRAGRNALVLLIVFFVMASLLPTTASAGGNNYVFEVGETHTVTLKPMLYEYHNEDTMCSNPDCIRNKDGRPIIFIRPSESGFYDYVCYEEKDPNDPDVLGNFQIDAVACNDEIGGYELVCTYETLKPGATYFTFWTRYRIQYPGGDVVCPDCGETTTVPAIDKEGTDSTTLIIDVMGSHTVIYNDGVDGEEVFPDDVHTCEQSTRTPEFTGGTPSREGYRFAGWYPELDYCVTRDITYRALWESAAVAAWGRLAVTTEIENSSTITPGGSLIYKTTVSNNTGKDLTGLVVDEMLDSRLTCVSATGDGSYDTGICTWTIPNLPNGASAVLTIEAKVQEGIADGTVIINRAAITGADAGEGDTLPASIGTSTSATVYADPTTVPEKPNERTLRMLLVDALFIDCVNTEVHHDAGAWGLIEDSYSVSPVMKETGTDGSEYFCCDINIRAEKYAKAYGIRLGEHRLAEGESAEKTIRLKHNGTEWEVLSGKPVTFQITCAKTTPPPTPGTVDWTKLTISSTCEGKAAPDESVTFTTTVTNNTGKDLDNVEVVVKLDSRLTYLGLRAADYDAGTGIWRIGALANGEKAVLNIVADIKEGTADGTRLTNTATIEKASAGAETLTEDKRASSEAETIVSEEPEAPDETKVTALLKNAVTLKCANTGAGHQETTANVQAGNYSLGEVKKDGGVYICDVRIQAEKFVSAYGTLTGEAHSLVKGESAEKTIRLKHNGTEWEVLSGKPVSFQMTCAQTPPTLPPIQDIWSGLSISMNQNKVIASPGESVTYTVTVTNKTGEKLKNVTVSEVLDQNLSFDSSTWTKNSTYDKKTGIWTISDLADDGFAVLTITGVVALDTEDDTMVLNVANITRATADSGETMPGQKLSNMVMVTVRSNAATKPFTLSYDANGGTNAPARQEVDVFLDTAEVQLRVSESKPSRLGYYFQGWSTARDGRVQYRGGDWITISGNTTLYAVWVKPTASPRTGDTSNLALWGTLAGVSVVAIGAAVVLMKKKTKKD